MGVVIVAWFVVVCAVWLVFLLLFAYVVDGSVSIGCWLFVW